MPTRFFRAGAAAVIYRDPHTIALFKRAVPPIGVWELPQGGIDIGELPHEALWRELKEELGCEVSDFERVDEVPDWTLYQGADSCEDDIPDRLGQAHRWFLLKLSNTAEINLAKATQPEVSEYKWTSFEEAIKEAPDYKKPVYRKVHEYFKTMSNE